MKMKSFFLLWGLAAMGAAGLYAQTTVFYEDFDNFSNWQPTPDNGAGCEWTAENGWAKIKTMGTNPASHIFAEYECNLPQPISPDEDFSFKAYIRCQDGDPSGSTSNTYIELMNANYERVAMLMWDDSQASRGYGGLTYSHAGGYFYDNDPTGFGRHNPTIDNELEIRREGTTYTAYLDGVQLGSPVNYNSDRTATKVVIITNKYRFYGQRDGRIDYIRIEAHSDNQPPVANAGEDQCIECTSSEGTPVSLDGTASYDPDNTPITYYWEAPGVQFDDPHSPNPTGAFPLGKTTVTLVVNDGQSDSEPDHVDIRVVDTTPPELTVSVSPDELWPPNHKMKDINVYIEVIDICDQNPSVVLESIVSNEPDDAPGGGDGNTIHDIQGADFGTDDRIFQLRAERSGSGDGRTYTMTYKARDACGNIETCISEVRVPNSKGELKKQSDISGDQSSCQTFHLYHNNPNPFNPETVIRYQLPQSTSVSLKIYNSRGQCIRSLIDQEQETGYYTIRWDGKDDFGSPVANGMYICRLQAGAYQNSIRMLLVR